MTKTAPTKTTQPKGRRASEARNKTCPVVQCVKPPRRWLHCDGVELHVLHTFDWIDSKKDQTRHIVKLVCPKHKLYREYDLGITDAPAGSYTVWKYEPLLRECTKV